jgi:serine/threonine-protein kinase RsbT
MSPPRPGLAATVPLERERDIAAARIAVSKVLDQLGAKTLAKVRFVTAVSEIARNAVVHGLGGAMEISVLDRPPGIHVRCTDSGPGIPDVDRAMADGYSTAGSLGKGLGGARRLVDRFLIENRPGGGTIIELTSHL